MYLSGHDSLSLCDQIALDAETVFKSAVTFVAFEPRDDSVIAAPGAFRPTESRSIGRRSVAHGHSVFRQRFAARFHLDKSNDGLTRHGEGGISF